MTSTIDTECCASCSVRRTSDDMYIFDKSKKDYFICTDCYLPYLSKMIVEMKAAQPRRQRINDFIRTGVVDF